MAYNLGSGLLSATDITTSITVTRTPVGEWIEGEYVIPDVPDIRKIRGVVSVPKDTEIQFLEGGSIQGSSYKKFHTKFPLRKSDESLKIEGDVVTLKEHGYERSYKIIALLDSTAFGFTRTIGVRVDA